MAKWRNGDSEMAMAKAIKSINNGGISESISERKYNEIIS
jgi:hypothetical protein